MAESAKSPPQPRPDSDLSGRQLGNYRVLRRLGRGAMAEVYLAEQISLRRQVAIKVLKGHLATDDTYVRRFHNEAQAAASLVHSNIVQIYEVGCVEGVHFIAQEYVPGQNLREWMVRRGPPDLRLAVAIMRQVAAALFKAAEQGTVHRDIKPENIMLAQSGEVKVADFGLARLSGEQDALNLTQVGMTMGTPLYMSPEQVEGRALDPRSDIYSLGVTCYHMLAGQPPFRGETALSVAVQHLNVSPERLELLRSDLPTGLCRIVHKMLEKKPDERYASPRELLKDLRGLHIEGADTAATTEETDDDWSGSELAALGVGRLEATQQLDTLMKAQVTSGRRSRWIAAAAAAVFASAAAGAVVALATRERFLLWVDPAAPTTEVDRRASAEDQLMYANLLNTEEGYKSVGQYFSADKDKPHVARAQQQLALWYLQGDRYDEALAIFDEFAKAPETEKKEERAFGFAGQVIVYAIQKKNSQYADTMAELHKLVRGTTNDGKPDIEKIKQSLDFPMRDLLEATYRRESGISPRPDPPDRRT